MQPIRENHPLRRLFAGLVEQAFCTELGLCDPRLTSYIADLLVQFTHIDQLRAIQNAQGKHLEQIAAMLLVLSEDAPSSPEETDRRMYRQIGDYALFWAGVYPEQLRHWSHSRSDVLLDYVTQGKRSYAIVSDLADDPPASTLFRHLSDDFESCLCGLGLVRRGLEEATPTDRTHPGEQGDLLY